MDHISNAARELRSIIRALASAPGFTVVFVVTLGLGIGANTAIFSLARGVLLRPIPHRAGDALIHVRQTAVVSALPDATFSVPEIMDYRTAASTVDGVSEFSALTFTMLGLDEPRRVRAGIVSGNYFDVLGLAPVRGRLFQSDDDGHTADPVMVLSHEFWRTVFGSDPEVVGETVRTNGRTVTIVGVLEPVPHYPERTDVFVNTVTSPHHMSAAMTDDRQHRMTQVFARLAPGSSVEEALTELDGIAGRLALEYPGAYVDVEGPRVSITPFKDELTVRARPMLFVLLGAAGFVLVIACANVANLTVSRALRRERELALRGALGAGQASLRGLLLMENLVLAPLGVFVGLAVTLVAWNPLVSFAARFTPRASEIELDGAVLVFTALTAIATAVVSAVAPRLPEPGAGGNARSTGGIRQRRLQRALAITQLAVSYVLLIGAGLLVRTLHNLQQVDPGFVTDNVLSMELPLSRGGNSLDDVRGFYDNVTRGLEELPGVTSVAAASQIPLTGAPVLLEVSVEGFQLDPNASVPRADYRAVSDEYFEAMVISRVAGRSFDATDRADTAKVVIINESMARFYFSERTPIGRRLRWSDEQTRFIGVSDEWRTVVGVVADTKDFGLDQTARHTVYHPFAQEPWGGGVVLRTSLAPSLVARQAADVVHRQYGDQPVEHVRTLRQARDETVAPQRLNAVLIGSFALLAAIIAGVGVFGVLAFSVSRRTQEFGIRLSFGADGNALLRLVLGEGLKIELAALALGAVASLALARFLRGFLFGVEPADPLTLGAVAVFLTGVAIAASWAPAARASRVQPVEALRAE